MKQYLSNLRTHLFGFAQIWRWPKEDFDPGWGPFTYTLLYIVNITPSVLTGGAPFDTLSSRWYKDGFYPLGRAHGKKVLRTLPGECSTAVQTITTIFWGYVLWQIWM